MGRRVFLSPPSPTHTHTHTQPPLKTKKKTKEKKKNEESLEHLQGGESHDFNDRFTEFRAGIRTKQVENKLYVHYYLLNFHAIK